MRLKFLTLGILSTALIFTMPGVFPATETDEESALTSAQEIDLDYEIADFYDPFTLEDSEERTDLEPIDEDLTVLFIGNSITYHEYIPGLWEGAWGMAASKPELDYVHQSGKQLEAIFDDVTVYIHKLSYWESPVAGTARGDYMPLVAQAVTETEPDVVVLQLGENVSDATTFTEDYMWMIETIQTAAPDAKIVMVGETLTDWDADIVETAKQNIAAYYELPYIDTTELLESPELYQAGFGYLYTGLDDEQYSIEILGVSHHLSDRGMTWLANRVTEEIVSFYQED